jgi:hypothetical protein
MSSTFSLQHIPHASSSGSSGLPHSAAQRPPQGQRPSAPPEAGHLAIRARARTAAPQGPAAPAQHQHDHGHDHGHGAIVVDVDEAVHGTYAAIAQLNVAAKKGPDAVLDQFRADARHWHDDPLGALGDGVVPHGAADFGLGLGVGGVLLPLGLVAAKAGIEEIVEARRNGKELAAAQREAEAVAAGLEALRSASAQAHQGPAALPETAGWLAHHQQQAADLRVARQQNRRAGEVGLGSLLSGGAIAASVAAKAGTQVPLVAVAGGVGQAGPLVSAGAAAGTAATVAGAAGTFVLAPLAAAGAMYLGHRFVRKTGEKRRHLQQSLQLTRPFLDAVRAEHGADGLAPPMESYQHFFDVKSRQREDFYKSFNRLNKLFLAGSAIYASGALGKAALAAAALGGAAALAHPAGLAAVVALGTVGGLAMGAGSLQFLTGHPKQHRYDGYFRSDHARLDRTFLAAVDVLLPPTQGPLQGLELRAGLYHALEQGEQQRQDFLQDIASSLGKHQGRHAWSTDRPDAGTPPGTHTPGTSIARRVGAGLRGVASYGKGLVQHHSFAQAQAAAAGTYGKHTDRLTLHRLAGWAQDCDNFPAQMRFMRAQLQLLRDSLQVKVDVRAGIALPDAPALPGGPQAAEPPHEQAALAAFIQGQRDGLARDGERLVQVKDMLGVLEMAGRSSRPDGPGMSMLRERFMRLQGGEPADAAQGVELRQQFAAPEAQAASARRFAKFLKRDAPRQFKDLRGMLLETEMQAARTRALAAELGAQLAAEPPPPATEAEERFHTPFASSRDLERSLNPMA